jgi:hypothetical protein
MKRILIALSLITVSAFATFKVLAACGSYFQPAQSDSFTGGPSPNVFDKTAYWTIYWTDGTVTNTPPVKVTEPGECYPKASGGYLACYPGYDTPSLFQVRLGCGTKRRTSRRTGVVPTSVFMTPLLHTTTFLLTCVKRTAEVRAIGQTTSPQVVSVALLMEAALVVGAQPS